MRNRLHGARRHGGTALALVAATVTTLGATFATADTTLERTFDLDAGGSLEVANVQGSVEIRTWSRNEVRLVAVLEGSPESLVVSHDGRHGEIRVEKDRRWFGEDDQNDAELELTIPDGVRLKVSTLSADISIDGHAGEARVQSVSGDITMAARSTEVEAETVSGNIDFEGSGTEGGRYRFGAVSGDTRIAGISGQLRLSSISGDASVEANDLEQIVLESVSGTVMLRAGLAPRARLKASAVSGDIVLALCNRGDVEFDLDSFSGDIVDRVSRRRPDESRYGPGAKLRFTEGSGNQRVRVNTMSGDIEITDCP